VATSNLAGRILRNLITGREDELSRLPVVNHVSPAGKPSRCGGSRSTPACGPLPPPTSRSA